MKANDKVVLTRDIRASIEGDVIPEGTEGTIIYKMSGSGSNTFEVDFGQYGIAICRRDDIKQADR